MKGEENFDLMTIDELEEQLSPKERIFCQEYLRLGKKGEAAEIAGYKDSANAATKLLKKAECLAYTRALQKRAREELNIDDNWAVLRAIEVYQRCMCAIPVMQWDYSEHKLVETGEYTFDSKGAINALKLIKELLGLGDGDNDTLTAAVTIINDFGGNIEK